MGGIIKEVDVNVRSRVLMSSISKANVNKCITLLSVDSVGYSFRVDDSYELFWNLWNKIFLKLLDEGDEDVNGPVGMITIDGANRISSTSLEGTSDLQASFTVKVFR